MCRSKEGVFIFFKLTMNSGKDLNLKWILWPDHFIMHDTFIFVSKVTVSIMYELIFKCDMNFERNLKQVIWPIIWWYLNILQVKMKPLWHCQVELWWAGRITTYFMAKQSMEYKHKPLTFFSAEGGKNIFKTSTTTSRSPIWAVCAWM